MKILTFSTLYPNAARPRHGIFVETQLRQQLKTGQVESMVVAPVPWFPSRNLLFGEYALHASAPREEQRYGIQVLDERQRIIRGRARGMALEHLDSGVALQLATESLAE